MQERIQKIIARAGVASRRKAEELITQGQVTVNGRLVTELGSKADAARDHIKVRGKLLVGSRDERLYLVLNKPRECVSTTMDPQGRRTVMDLVGRYRSKVYPVGRLDYHSEGLLLLTNDGDFANHVLSAKSAIPKTYHVKVNGKRVTIPSIKVGETEARDVIAFVLPLPGLHAHRVKVTAGSFEPGMTVRAEVDAERRFGAMRHHTSTHLLHAALREFLGPHVKQTGSLVEPDRLRFDFSHYQGVSDPELRHMENRVNEVILRDSALEVRQMGREAALAYGALAFFGDKYGESVRVVEVPGFSKEFCGGTHVHQTGQIGLFLVTNEQGISAGNRRLEAVTGAAALEVAQRDQGILEELEQAAKVDRRSLVDEYAKLKEQLKARERELQALKMKLATGASGSTAGADLQQVGDVQVWTPRFEGLDRRQHATVVDEFRNRNIALAIPHQDVHVLGLDPLIARVRKDGESQAA